MSVVCFEYRLSARAMQRNERELTDVGPLEFQYVLFPGDVVCEIDGTSLSLVGGELPLLEFAMSASDALDRLQAKPFGTSAVMVDDSAYGFRIARGGRPRQSRTAFS